MRPFLPALAVVSVILACAVLFLILFPPPHGDDRPLVYVVYGTEKGDSGYTDSAYRGLFRAQEAFSFRKEEFSMKDRDTVESLLKGPGEKPGLVITVGAQYTNDTAQWAKTTPGTWFLAVDQTGIGQENAGAVEITSYGQSYLAGVLAAEVTGTKQVGIILGTPSGLLDGFVSGFSDGVRARDPAVTVVHAYVAPDAAGFDDPAGAERIAASMYKNHTDVIYTVAGFSGTGAIREAGKAPGRYIIGVDSDQSGLGPAFVLASSEKDVDSVVFSGIARFLNGTPEKGDRVTGLLDNTTRLVFNPVFSRYREDVLSYSEQAQREEARYLASRALIPKVPG